MITLRLSQERGRAQHGWLDSYHTFSFADYYDPRHMGFGNLRVINHDFVEAARGFGEHPHRDMEIITYVIQGAVTHTDSMGHQEKLGPGEIQVMTAGTGVRHSEVNLEDETLELLQIWVLPRATGLPPAYRQKRWDSAPRHDHKVLLCAPKGKDAVVAIEADAELFQVSAPAQAKWEEPLAPGRGGWLQVISGSVKLGGKLLGPGDGAAVTGEKSVAFETLTPLEALWFRVPVSS